MDIDEIRENLNITKSMRQYLRRIPTLTCSDLSWDNLLQYARSSYTSNKSEADSIARQSQLIQQSIIIKTTEGNTIMMFWKDVAHKAFGDKNAKRMQKDIVEAIHTLGPLYPPPIPNHDFRHTDPGKAVKIHGENNVGVYHFARWVATGQSTTCPPVLSKDMLAAHGAERYIYYIANFFTFY